MERKLLINAAEEEECRIALISDGRLEFLDRALRLREQYKGNVYKGQVVRIEPSLQAAFVEFSHSHRAGFLPMAEIMPDIYETEESDEERRSRPRIEEVVKKGMELIVQVVKEETGKKGAALSTYISLAGQYLVLMPGNSNGGISRKIEDEEDRKRLKKIINDLKMPDGVGIIVRTAGLGRTKTELNRDLQSQTRLWKEIEKKSDDAAAPTLLHQEADVLIRTLRDNFSTDIDEVICDTEDAFERAQAFLKAGMPRYVNRVKHFEGPGPLFGHFKVEEQIEQLKHNRVTLPSGGWIVLEQTEAMVCVDVNSGRATQERGIEKTALRTNLEAAEEVARQLRLRDLGGLVVIDFIDMKDAKHLRQIEKTFKNAMKIDRARHEIGKVSKFCLMELSRQRLKSRNHSSSIRCSRCGGTGTVQTPEAEALSVLRMIQSHCSRGTVSAIRLAVPVRVARYLLNQKRWKLSQLEQAYQVSITVIPDPNLDNMRSAPTPELSRRSAPPPGEFPRPVEGLALPAPTHWPRRTEHRSFDIVADDPNGRNKRRRRRKRRGRDRHHDDYAPARDLPRRVTDRSHKAPIDSLGKGSPLPPEHADFGTKAPDASLSEHLKRPESRDDRDDRRDDRRDRNDRHDRSSHRSSRRSHRDKDMRGSKDKKKTSGRKSSDKQPRDSKRGGKKVTRPVGLPKDEDMIHPDDLERPPVKEEVKPSVAPAPPVQEEPPVFPWGFGFMDQSSPGERKATPAPPPPPPPPAPAQPVLAMPEPVVEEKKPARAKRTTTKTAAKPATKTRRTRTTKKADSDEKAAKPARKPRTTRKTATKTAAKTTKTATKRATKTGTAKKTTTKRTPRTRTKKAESPAISAPPAEAASAPVATDE